MQNGACSVVLTDVVNESERTGSLIHSSEGHAECLVRTSGRATSTYSGGKHIAVDSDGHLYRLAYHQGMVVVTGSHYQRIHTTAFGIGDRKRLDEISTGGEGTGSCAINRSTGSDSSRALAGQQDGATRIVSTYVIGEGNRTCSIDDAQERHVERLVGTDGGASGTWHGGKGSSAIYASSHLYIGQNNHCACNLGSIVTRGIGYIVSYRIGTGNSGVHRIYSDNAGSQAYIAIIRSSGTGVGISSTLTDFHRGTAKTGDNWNLVVADSNRHGANCSVASSIRHRVSNRAYPFVESFSSYLTAAAASSSTGDYISDGGRTVVGKSSIGNCN